MTEARQAILSRIRQAGRRKDMGRMDKTALQDRLETPPRGPIPTRACPPHAEQVNLFVRMAKEAKTTVHRVSNLEKVPATVADILGPTEAGHSLKLAPHPLLQSMAWKREAQLQPTWGTCETSDRIGLSVAFAGIAETGTLMMLSGPDSPVLLNFLPEIHFVLLRDQDVVGCYEEAWDRMRKGQRDGKSLPRCIHWITGPSRTGDIEQTIVLGAHGPQQLKILLVNG